MSSRKHKPESGNDDTAKKPRRVVPAKPPVESGTRESVAPVLTHREPQMAHPRILAAIVVVFAVWVGWLIWLAIRSS